MIERITKRRRKLKLICQNKSKFYSKRRASWRAKQLSEETGDKWRYYQCGRHWHLTNDSN